MSVLQISDLRALCEEGRFLDFLDELEKIKIRLTLLERGFKLDGPNQALTAELSDLLDQYQEEVNLVVRLSTLAADRFGNTRLHAAVLESNLPEVERHLLNGARPNATNLFGQSSFHLALQDGNRVAVELLARYGADLGLADLDGRTPLHMAVEKKDSSLVLFLLANRTPVNKGDFFGITPLARAIGSDQKEIAELILEYQGELVDPELSVLERDFLQLVLRMIRGYSDELYQHSLRVADLARCLARTFDLSEDEVKTARLGGLLHDLGKVSLPDDIFDQADDEVAEEDIELLISHPEDGAQALNPHLTPSKWPVHPIILHHHEKWDGSGFPQGLEGDEIPFLAQLVGVADYYDHLVTHRSYDPAVSQEQALALLSEQIGGHFSEDVVHALYEAKDLLPFYSP